MKKRSKKEKKASKGSESSRHSQKSPPKSLVEEELSVELPVGDTRAVLANFAAACSQLAQIGGNSAELGDCLERCVVAVEELRTLNELTCSEADSSLNQLVSLNAQFDGLQPLFEHIDALNERLRQKEEELSALERRVDELEIELSRKAKFRQELEKASAEEDIESSDEDAPVEVSSHRKPDIVLTKGPEEEPSLFEQVEARRKEREEKSREKDREKRRKKRLVKKLDKGQFEIAVKKSTFKVVTLDEGVASTLVPTVNFREELLQQRTQHRREKSAAMRRKVKG